MLTGFGKSNIMKLEDTFYICYYDYIKIEAFLNYTQK